MIRDKIVGALQKASGIKDPNLELPEDERFGDYSTNAAFQSGNPRKTAEEIVSKLEKDKELREVVRKVEVAGNGFINFWLKKEVLVSGLMQIDGSDLGKGKTVVIDYSSPNIAKAFGIGHLRSTIIGQALYNIYKFLGYEVVGDNHLGDWGTQFGILLHEITSRKLNVDSLDVSELEDLYVDFHKKAKDDPEMENEARAWFKKLEDGDKQARRIWKKCVEISLEEFERIYKLLNVKIDFALGESYYESEMKSLIADSNVKKYITKGEDGAKIIDLAKFGIKTPLMFLKKDGGTTYATRDLATIAFRVRKWDPDIIIYEVGAEQSLHFRQVFASARLLGLVGDKVELVHTAHGLYLGPEGKKFSTRKGETIKLEEVLDEAVKKAKLLGNKSEEVAKQVGIGAIKYFDLMHYPASDIVFDWEKVINLQGNSGPYLQYTVARAGSVLAKSGDKIPDIKVGKDITADELMILRTLFRFSDITINAAKTYSPNILCSYLFDLASKFNAFYNKYRILEGDNQDFRLALTEKVAEVLTKGLTLLGIETPDKM